MAQTILVTGGAGFIGSSLALNLKSRTPDDRVIALDNLKRRGAELALGRLRKGGVEFRHGDVRQPDDLDFGVRPDVIIECSAEPSVHAGRDGHVRYVLDSNLTGCINCLELARRSDAALVFLSTSRVYPTAQLAALRLQVRGSRFHLLDEQAVPGASVRGIAEEFPLDGARTLYGATKLAAELLIAEYVDMFGLRAVINRCGVVSGAWQMGHAEQGVFAHWAMAHVFRRPLTYIGYGGCGHQVRDVLHVADLEELVAAQLAQCDRLHGEVFNAGGGIDGSTSLAEFTDLCGRLTGVTVPIEGHAATRPGDVPVYISDNSRVTARFRWVPRRTVEDVAVDLVRWIRAHGDELTGIFG